MGLAVAMTKKPGWSYPNYPWLVRAFTNVTRAFTNVTIVVETRLADSLFGI
jgi:hypothetical protein